MLGPKDTMDVVLKRLDADVDRIKAQGLQAVAMDALVGEARKVATEIVQEASRALSAANSADLSSARAEIQAAARALGDSKVPERLEQVVQQVARHARDLDAQEAAQDRLGRAQEELRAAVGQNGLTAARVQQVEASAAGALAQIQEARAAAARAESYAREVADSLARATQEISDRLNALAERVSAVQAAAARPRPQPVPCPDPADPAGPRSPPAGEAPAAKV
jgi:chromosome segregation ATPase